MLVSTADSQAQFAREQRNTAHEGAADPENVQGTPAHAGGDLPALSLCGLCCGHAVLP
jgi:hypothetical protein